VFVFVGREGSGSLFLSLTYQQIESPSFSGIRQNACFGGRIDVSRYGLRNVS
jgi:hypothetical protein